MTLARHLAQNRLTQIPAQLVWNRMSERVFSQAKRLKQFSDLELLESARKLKQIILEKREKRSHLIEGFALVRESARRTQQMLHYKNQLIAGFAMLDNYIIEMATGEGKTLSALLPVFIRALSLRGCHVITTNDYLAKRDADFARSILSPLGISVGSIQNSMDASQRRQEYSKDVTYTTEREVGFDFLKDCLSYEQSLVASPSEKIIEPPIFSRNFFHAAIIDEADSVLVDQARSPLIIAEAVDLNPAEGKLYRWCYQNCEQLTPQIDYQLLTHRRVVKLLKTGRDRIILWDKMNLERQSTWDEIFQAMEQSLTAKYYFRLNKEYVIQEGKIEIVDQNTGRVSAGRKWQRGLHLAIEIKEAIQKIIQTRTTAQTTMQQFLSRYQYLGGMTGTVASLSGELKKYYGLKTIRIATHQPTCRTRYAHRIFTAKKEKLQAIYDEVEKISQNGRAVLIGVSSVESSSELAEYLKGKGLCFTLLNAIHHEQEAAIIAKAGQPGKITIATNMAGRGTDIKVHPEVLLQGGLHVILTEMHHSNRIDRQLIGRAARQGEPGSYQYYLSLEDEIFEGVSKQLRERLEACKKVNLRSELPPRIFRWFQEAQKQHEQLACKTRIKNYQQIRNLESKLQGLGLFPELIPT